MSARSRAGRLRVRSRLLALLSVLLLPLAALTALAAPAHAAGRLTATFTTADNGSWWQGTYIVHNDNATAVTGWTLEFDLPAGVTIGNSYNGTATVNGQHVTATNAFYNATVPAHGSTEPYSFWFVGNGPAVQGYDFHGSGSDNSWEPNRTGHQANLYADPKDPYNFHFSVDAAVQAYLGAGVNPRKLTIGFPFYGRGWQGVADGGASGVWQPANGAAPGQFAEEAGTRGYNNLITGVPNLAVHHDPQSVATYGYTGAGGQWWTFDDAWSIAQKTAYLRSKNLLGGMIWEMSGDTPSGTLMTALDTGLK